MIMRIISIIAVSFNRKLIEIFSAFSDTINSIAKEREFKLPKLVLRFFVSRSNVIDMLLLHIMRRLLIALEIGIRWKSWREKTRIEIRTREINTKERRVHTRLSDQSP